MVGELIGEGASHERVAVGETPNLAARLQALAAPDSVVISDSTWSLAGGAFNYQDLGPQTLKGIPRRFGLFVRHGRAEQCGQSLRGQNEQQRCDAAGWTHR